MKTLKFLGCIALIAAAVVYAAKTPYVITTPNGVVSFLDSKANAKKLINPGYTNINGVAVITPVSTLKSGITIVGATLKPSIMLIGGAKSVKTKLAKGTVTTIDNVGALVNTTVILSNGTLVTGFAPAIVGSIQLKGVNVGTVFAAGLGTVQADTFVNVLGDLGAKGKGIKIQALAKVGFSGGTSSSNVPSALGGLGVIKGTVKGLDTKDTLRFLNLSGATPVKLGKTMVKVKNASTVYDTPTTGKWKVKPNVTILPVPTAPTGTTYAVTQ